MKVTEFISNQPRHLNLTKEFAKFVDKLIKRW